MFIRDVIQQAGYDPDDPHFTHTDRRWQSALLNEFVRPRETVLETLFTEFEDAFHGMVVAKNIEFSALCMHHLLPFFGKAHIGFLPDGKVLGLSKYARIVEYFTHQITIQEKATRAIAQALLELKPRGLAVVLDGVHTCMMTRGVRQESCQVTTAELHGLFRTEARVREEFYQHLNRR